MKSTISIPSAHQSRLDQALQVVPKIVSGISFRLPPHVCRDDLASVGRIAVIEAERTLPAEMHPQEVVKLCYVRARGAILDELRREDPLSRRLRKLKKAIDAALDVVASAPGVAITIENVADTARMPVEQVRNTMLRVVNTQRVPIPSDESSFDVSADSPSEHTSKKEICSMVACVVDDLPQAQAMAIRLLFLEGLPLKDVIVLMGMSAPTVIRHRERGLVNLRHRLLRFGIAEDSIPLS